MEFRISESRELVKQLAVTIAAATVRRAAKLPIAGLSKRALLWLPAGGAPSILNGYLKLLVSPTAIRGEAHIPRTKKKWFMPSGDWDINLKKPVARTTSYRIMEAVFVYGTSFQRSSIYQELANIIHRKGVIRLKTNVLLRSEEELSTYMGERLELLNALSKTGVSAGVREPVRVAIGRNGDILKVSDGRHRIAAAQFLRLRHIGVMVAHVHPELISQLPRANLVTERLMELLRSYELPSDSFSLIGKEPTCAGNSGDTLTADPAAAPERL